MFPDPSAYDKQFLQAKVEPQSGRTSARITAVDLFSGCGGLSLGARTACLERGFEYRPLMAVDSDRNSLGTYVRNFRPNFAVNEAIELLLPGQFGSSMTRPERDLKNGLASIDILLAGPPCQGHSNLNNHTRRIDDRNRLYEKVGRFAEIARPTHIIVENVPAIVHSQERSFQRTLEMLERLGYQCDHGVVNLVDLGVPQKRKRQVLVASLAKRVEFGIFVSSVVETHKVAEPRSVRWAIEDLENMRSSELYDSPSVLSSNNRRRIAYLFENELYDLPNPLRPRCHQNNNHSYRSMYGRLNYDLPAQTITSGFSSPGQGRFIHPTQARTLTPHEAARLQFFPDFFDFSGVAKRGALAQMIGNAVPMKLSYVFSCELFF